ncbi:MULTISPECIES: efflux RND transporter periplasmic adaptor subunit [Sphingobacterium]|jgi:cobalt-zinc-cadmium efflux system membrane fusion protein|uniref:Cation efflux system protein CzcB n=1 Tax=Sphingobacterium multivorum TaxID=28454 RepID=A0A653Y1R6_SPHMU|nr:MULTISPECIES: efflux RND transporter periplasmic adaptor subunit [Sphingobacterium]SUJ88369.1 Cation efflux system protein CzcB [Sphingobacterium multivorum]VXC36224.1 Cation efflux system protein CzcB [Sphingobacterium multivorum]HAK29315.1 efflux transporter periplasmic adaptor subunit [Sphingobacterium sp.]HBI88593.1 efflux transporter periplasmic adaptor subunit [Sphingobacterium sp.]
MKTKNLLSHYMVYVLAIVCISCHRNTENAASKPPGPKDENLVSLTDAQLRNAHLEIVTLADEPITNILKVNGKIDVPPQNFVSVSIPLGGYLKSTKLLPGMKVSKGDVIAVVENPQFVQLQQDYLSAQSKLHFAQLDFRRQKELNQNQASSDKVMQQAQAEMNSQQIIMNAIAKQLELIHIQPSTVSAENIRKSAPVYSTIDGYVSKVNVNIGKYVNPSDILFELINPTDIHLNLKVYEKDLEQLRPGQLLLAYSNANPSKKYNGKIHLIGKDVDPSGMTDVHCHLDKYDQNMIPGVYMNAEIQTTATLGHALPEESIVDFEGKNYVFISEGNSSYRLAEIAVEEPQKGLVKVLNYRDFEGKKIVSKNAYTLLMQLKNTSEE